MPEVRIFADRASSLTEFIFVFEHAIVLFDQVQVVSSGDFFSFYTKVIFFIVHVKGLFYLEFFQPTLRGSENLIPKLKFPEFFPPFLKLRHLLHNFP